MKKKKLKRIAAALLSACLILPMMPTVTYAEGSTTVYENGFEEDLGGFSANGDASIEKSQEKAKTGDSSMKVSENTADWHGAKLSGGNSSMTLDGLYEISAYVYSEAEVQVVMQIILDKTDDTKDYKWLESQTLTAGEWTLYSAQIEIPSSDYKGIDGISFENKTSPFDSPYFIDDVKIVKIKDLTPPEKEDSKEPMKTIDFADGELNGFYARGGTEVLEVTNEAAYSGEYSLKTTNRTLGWHAPALHIENYIAQGQEYEITVWVHSLTASKTNFTLSTQIGNGEGASYNNITSQKLSADDGWVKLTGKYRYSNTTSEFIIIYVENDDVNAEYYIDDISVIETVNKDIEADLTLPSLAEVYKDYFLLGGIFSQVDLSGIRFEMLKHHFNVLTAENAMKPDAMLSEEGVYRFNAVNEMLVTIGDANMAVHGHTLGWHQQSPEILNKNPDGTPLARAEAAANLRKYVQTVATEYKGKVISWDVLNEAMNDGISNPSDWKSALRRNDSPWYCAFATDGDGSDYIDMLFREARSTDPGAKLYYNDYNLDNQNKSTAVANMVKEINDKYLAEGNDRLLIEGVGMQGHYSLNTSIDNVEASIKRFKEIGIVVSISELDVTIPNASANGLTEEEEYRQAAKYAQLFQIFKKYSDTIERVTIWGLDDATSWRSAQYPLLFNSDLSAKQAYYAVADPDKFLENYIEPEKPVVLQGTAFYGTPIIDGTIDSAWENAEKLPVKQMLQAWPTASGYARVLWDENNIYVLFEVSADALDNTSENPWEQSSIEVFFDESNCKAGSYSSDDGQYRVCFDNTQSFGGSTNSDGLESMVTVNGTSYTVELKIPFKETQPQAGAKIGFDAQVNDAGGGTRTGVAMWCDTSGDSWDNTLRWGELTLVGKDIPTDPKDPETPKTPETKNETKNEANNETSSEISPKTGQNTSNIIACMIGSTLLLTVSAIYTYKAMGIS